MSRCWFHTGPYWESLRLDFSRYGFLVPYKVLETHEKQLVFGRTTRPTVKVCISPFQSPISLVTTDPGEVTSFPPHWHDQYLQADQQAVLTSLDRHGPYLGVEAGLMTSPPPDQPTPNLTPASLWLHQSPTAADLWPPHKPRRQLHRLARANQRGCQHGPNQLKYLMSVLYNTNTAIKERLKRVEGGGLPGGGLRVMVSWLISIQAAFGFH